MDPARPEQKRVGRPLAQLVSLVEANDTPRVKVAIRIPGYIQANLASQEYQYSSRQLAVSIFSANMCQCNWNTTP
jgi:hypothetical protein